jgi:hypothetical protein
MAVNMRQSPISLIGFLCTLLVVPFAASAASPAPGCLGKLQPINFANFATARDAIICARTDLTYTTTEDYKNRTKGIDAAKVSRCGRNLLKAKADVEEMYRDYIQKEAIKARRYPQRLTAADVTAMNKLTARDKILSDDYRESTALIKDCKSFYY